MKMTFLKSLTFLALAGFLVSAPLLAEPKNDNRNAFQGPQSAETQLARMSEALGLSDNQAVQVLQVLQSARAEREAIHDRVMEQYGPEICALKEDTEAEILAILTPEQADLLLQKKEERADKADNRRKHGREGFDCAE